MKPDPLKNKKVLNADSMFTKLHDKSYILNPYFFEKDVKSAVEYLKERFLEEYEDVDECNIMYDIIDKAFEDVIEK